MSLDCYRSKPVFINDSCECWLKLAETGKIGIRLGDEDSENTGVSGLSGKIPRRCAGGSAVWSANERNKAWRASVSNARIILVDWMLSTRGICAQDQVAADDLKGSTYV